MKCILRIETDDDQLTFLGYLHFTELGFRWQLDETAQEFELPSSGFLVFAKHNGDAIYCQLDRQEHHQFFEALDLDSEVATVWMEVGNSKVGSVFDWYKQTTPKNQNENVEDQQWITDANQELPEDFEVPDHI